MTTKKKGVRFAHYANPKYAPEIAYVTREEAKKILGGDNSHNRNTSRFRILKYRRQMNEGKWHPYVDGPIVMDTKGRLLNGKHRLHALVESDVEGLSFCFVCGVEPEVFSILDDLKARNLTDYVGILLRELGISSSAPVSQIATATRHLWFAKNEKLHISKTTRIAGGVDERDFLECLHNNQGLVDAVVWVRQQLADGDIKIRPVVHGVILYLLTEAGEETKAKRFFRQIITGTNIKAASGPHAYRKFLPSIYVPKPTGGGMIWTGSLSLDFGAVINCWNAYSKNARITEAAFSDSDDPFPSKLLGYGRVAEQITRPKTKKVQGSFVGAID